MLTCTGVDLNMVEERHRFMPYFTMSIGNYVCTLYHGYRHIYVCITRVIKLHGDDMYVLMVCQCG